MDGEVAAVGGGGERAEDGGTCGARVRAAPVGDRRGEGV